MCCSSMGLGLFLFCLVTVSSSSDLFGGSFPPVSELPVNYMRENAYNSQEKLTYTSFLYLQKLTRLFDTVAHVTPNSKECLSC